MKISRGLEHHKLLCIANNYNYSIKRIGEIKHGRDISVSQNEILYLYEKYVSKVKYALRCFNALEISILEREYFTPLPKGWWSPLYPKSTFYRLRLMASKKFLENFQYDLNQNIIVN